MLGHRVRGRLRDSGRRLRVLACQRRIEAKWQISDKPLVPFGSKKTVEYLSVERTTASDGWQLSQLTDCDDILTKWPMQACRSIASLEGVPERIKDEEEPPLAEVRLAQRMAGGLNWLATRTRPDIAFVVGPTVKRNYKGSTAGTCPWQSVPFAISRERGRTASN